MANASIEAIKQLAGRFRDNERNLTLYFPDLDTAPADDSLNRVFGAPVGLTDAQWPTFPELGELLLQTRSMQHFNPADQRMEHVFTVDLRGIDLLGAPADAAAMMLFISNASFHRASHEGNRHTAVLFLTEDELRRRGVYRGQLPSRSRSHYSRRFSLVAVDVPGDVFDVPELDLPINDPLVLLYHAIAAAPARLGGCPTEVREEQTSQGWEESSPTLPWEQTGPVQRSTSTLPYHDRYEAGSSATGADDRHTRAYQALDASYSPAVYEANRRSSVRSSRSKVFLGSAPAAARASHRPAPRPRTSGLFLMQFQRRFADINLGDTGVMYVSGQSAFCPSH